MTGDTFYNTDPSEWISGKYMESWTQYEDAVRSGGGIPPVTMDLWIVPEIHARSRH